MSEEDPREVHLETGRLTSAERYRLLTSLVVPRPIGWLSTRGPEGVPNLAPFSYFSALASTPMLVGVSIGSRGGVPKDTLRNVRSSRAFCVNVVSEPLLEAMNATSANVPADVDEFALAGLEARSSDRVDAPFVAGCPAVLECELRREVELDGAPNTLVIGEVVGVRLDGGALTLPAEGWAVDPRELRPVGRLGGSAYAMPGEVRLIDRP